MKKAANIFLLILLVLIQTPVVQLFKIPHLVQHYTKHQQQDGISWIGFLEEHYNSDHNDADWPEDEQLPFKNISFYSIGYAIVPGMIKASVHAPLQTKKKTTLPEHLIPQQDLASIFHPPRV